MTKPTGDAAFDALSDLVTIEMEALHIALDFISLVGELGLPYTALAVEVSEKISRKLAEAKKV